MKIVNLKGGQGSEAWLQFRATRFGSSEAAAMLGLSPYTTRTELLRLKSTGIGKEFGDWFQRNVLDKGHAVEAATRPAIEAEIGESLYPVTCAEDDGPLVASCDGLTDGLGDKLIAWECKQWNEALAAEVSAGRVPDTHMPQCQHILMVTGADVLIFTVSDGARCRVSVEVLPDPAWFDRLRAGWAQFAKDLAVYVPKPAADPAPVGRAPDTLPALRIEVTGAVTASNLADFKATALAAIRGVNRNLKTDADFADADKAVKWCADVESRLKAAKEHALSQTADIDALFKALDDISKEARDVRLDLAKLVERRKVERKEEAVAAARRELEKHIADLNGELAPMALRLQPVDFAGAIKGLRSFASMDDALSVAVANGKIAADAQARQIRGNVTVFNERTGGSRALQALFADLGVLVHKAADDFATLVDSRINKHRADEAERERKRQEAEAARIAEAERRAAAEAEARVRAEQEANARREREAAEADRRRIAAEEAAAAAPATNAEKLATAQRIVDQVMANGNTAEVRADLQVLHDTAVQVASEATAAANEPATLKLGDINARLSPISVTPQGLNDLGIPAAGRDRAAVLFRESQFPLIVTALHNHLSRVLAQGKKAA